MVLKIRLKICIYEKKVVLLQVILREYARMRAKRVCINEKRLVHIIWITADSAGIFSGSGSVGYIACGGE